MSTLFFRWVYNVVTLNEVFLDTIRIENKPYFTDVAPTRKYTAPIYIMPCLCNKNGNWTNLTQDEILTFLTKELTIQKNATSLSLYKLKSREDPRPTSAIVGVIGSVLIGGMFGLLLLSDVPLLVRHLRAAVTAQPLDQTNQRRRNAIGHKRGL